MDILRKELTDFYASQQLGNERLNSAIVTQYKSKVEALSSINNACYVITDAYADICYIYTGSLFHMLGISNTLNGYSEYDSSDEDIIYNCMHPEDLVEKRMLEYDYFRYVDRMGAEEKLQYVATCRIRIRNSAGEYIYIRNTTRILNPSPHGNVWLILCSYEQTSEQEPSTDISPAIINNHTGEVQRLHLIHRRDKILSSREKEILNLVKDGKSSKQIADILSISINTVNRHRQNVLEKLSVSNSHEAITAAIAMKLL